MFNHDPPPSPTPPPRAHSFNAVHPFPRVLPQILDFDFDSSALEVVALALLRWVVLAAVLVRSRACLVRLKADGTIKPSVDAVVALAVCAVSAGYSVFKVCAPCVLFRKTTATRQARGKEPPSEEAGLRLFFFFFEHGDQDRSRCSVLLFRPGAAAWRR